MKRKTAPPWLAALCLCFLSAGCASVSDAPGSEARLFFDNLNRYPRTREALRIPKLTAAAFKEIPAQPSPDVIIIVHPGYSLFFRDSKKARYSAEKYALLIKQFENEARFISQASRTGKIVVLIVPGNYQSESAAPLSYTSYLNSAAGPGRSVFYLYSTSASSGAISMNDMIDLYRFLQGVRVGKVLVGGGYIGRCQREFFNAVTAYFDQASSFIVPEISTISPDDISDSEAVAILESIQRQDYTPVKKFIDKKLDEPVNILSLPQKREP